MANDTLAPCDGYLTPVTPEALSGAKPFHYSLNIKDPDKMGLYKCSCTAKFYDYVAGCTTCFQGPGVNVTVDSFETFAGYCLNAGYDVNDPSKQPATPPKTSAKAPPSPTPSPKQNPTTPPPPSSKKSCNTPNDPCIAVNETLTICGGVFSPPFKSTSSGSYGVDDPKLAPCMCNDKFYQQLKNCTMCFATPTNNITVVPLDKFKEECSKLGVTYGATL
ncbi:10094_t:CDS:2 [Funneliformis geosporum]|nr:10094_t:CDS:2 [Funneliformis geosporum]